MPNSTLKCLLLDVELPGLVYLRMLCEQIPRVEVVKAFSDPMELVKESPELDYDVCILDIEMPGLNGLQVAELIKDKPVIFITAHKEYAAEAFDLGAIDYIRKPITMDRFEKAIRRAIKCLKPQQQTRQFVQVNTSKGKALLLFDQLLYVTTSQQDKRDKVALLEDKQELVLKNISFDELEEILPDTQFCRINKAEIIAFRAVRFFSHDEIETTLAGLNGKVKYLSLSRHYSEHFLSKIRR
ncbi:MAG: response regulator transcription factor [Saprospiraceae bacterium]|nr:response regulator transcription factor [Saprospiraceae bacterium]